MRQMILTLGAATFLAGCGDPLSGVARLGDVPTANGTASVAAAAQAPREGGLFSRLLNRPADDPTNAAVDAALADVTVAAEPAPSEAAVEDATATATEIAVRSDRPATGLFGLFRGGQSDASQRNEDGGAVVQAAAPAPPRGFAGLFGGRTNSAPRDIPRAGPDREDVAAGEILPFGQIARVCGMTRSQFGTRIDDGGGFSVYDTNPNLTTPRPFYITGFNDNCARTFTGAVAVTGNIQTHEFVRYQSSNERINYTATDNAYEAIKASVCRVGRSQPCGSRSDRLNRNTYFLSVYSFFGGTFSAVPTKWTQILLHDGEVLAASIKNN